MFSLKNKKHNHLLLSPLIGAFLFCLNFLTFPLSSTAKETSEVITIDQIEVKILDIYSNENTNWWQSLANKYHIKTKESVILAALPFKTGDKVTSFQLREAERLLRLKTYLRDATVRLSDNNILVVEVTESWSLLPTVNLNRTGGKNSSAFGIRDSNFLGLGISTTLRYQKDHQKSGYRTRISAPLNSSKPSFVTLLLEEYDAGSQQSVSYTQPFYTIDTEEMYSAAVINSDLENTYYQNDNEIGITQIDSENILLKYAWLDKRFGATAKRQGVGLYTYSSNLLQLNNEELIDLFKLREKFYLYWEWEQYQSKFKILENIFITGNKEDINFGTQSNYKLAIGEVSFVDNDFPMGNLSDSDLFKTSLSSSKMLKLDYSTSLAYQFADSLLFASLRSNIELYKNKRFDNYYTAAYRLDFFQPITNKVSFYAKNEFSYQSEHRTTPHSIGGDTGLRGFPVQYQYGKKRWLTSIELRYYSDVELWETFSFAWVTFVDFGRAWDNDLTSNFESSHLSSIGIGARVFPLVTSGRHVIHIDLAKPSSSNPNLENWEWRVQVKNSF